MSEVSTTSCNPFSARWDSDRATSRSKPLAQRLRRCWLRAKPCASFPRYPTSTGSAVIGTPPGIDCAIAKYTPAGALVWAWNWSGIPGASANTVVTPHGLAVDASNNIIAVGYFGLSGSTNRATADLDPGPGTFLLTNSGGWDSFIAKLDAGGNIVWARTFGCITNSPTDERAWDVAVNAAGEIYVTGFIQGSYDLDASATGSNVVTSAGGSDLFVARYYGSGVLERAVRIGGPQDEVAPPGTMRVGPDGNVYLTGRFRGVVDLNPGAGLFTVTNNSAPAAADIFVLSLGGDLNFRWGFALPSDGALDGGHRVTFDSRTNLYVTGWYSGTPDFAGSTNTFNLASMNTNGARDCFLAKYDRNGSFLWARSFGGVTSNAAALSIPAGLTVDSADAALSPANTTARTSPFDPAIRRARCRKVSVKTTASS